MTTLEWFRLMDVDRSKTVTIGEMLNFFLNSEEPLGARLCGVGGATWCPTGRTQGEPHASSKQVGRISIRGVVPVPQGCKASLASRRELMGEFLSSSGS